jgi:hypothetical protein
VFLVFNGFNFNSLSQQPLKTGLAIKRDQTLEKNLFLDGGEMS